jgi:hypothetical protein
MEMVSRRGPLQGRFAPPLSQTHACLLPFSQLLTLLARLFSCTYPAYDSL